MRIGVSDDVTPRPRSREDECLRRFRTDADAAAMEEFVRLTRPRLLAIAGRIGARQDAEDSVQAAYHALLRRTDLPGDANVVAWLVTATVRIAYRRKALVRRDAALAERLGRSREDGGSHHLAIRDEDAALVRDAVHRLPRRYRDALVLHHLEELPLADVARLLDVPVATAKTRVQRGRVLLRLRLESRFALGVVAAPWLLAETVRAAPVVGGIMQAKTTIAAVALIAAAIAVGVAVREGSKTGERTDTADAAAPAARRAEPRKPVASRPRQRSQDTATPSADTGTSAAIPLQTQPKPAARADPNSEEAITARIAEAAKSLNVSEDALRAANAAYRLLRDDTPKGGDAEVWAKFRAARTEAFAALTSHGEQGFLALIALLRGGRNGTYFHEMVPVTAWRGRLPLLIELAEKKDGPQWVEHTAIGCLGETDCVEAREYLLDRVRRERDPGTYYAVARSLGRLKEARGVMPVRELLRTRGALAGPAWNDVLAAYVCTGVVQMDRDTGGQLLDECARDPEFPYPAQALDALGLNGRVDLARSAAEALVATERLRQLSARDKSIVEKWAKAQTPR